MVAKPTSATGTVERTERAFRQDAELAMGADPVRAIVELVTNSDDAYVGMEPSRKGPIRIEVERHRSHPTIVIVKDKARGMTYNEMIDRLGRDGVRSSGFERGMDVRGLLGRGAKDCVAFGEVEWRSCRLGKEASFLLKPSGRWKAMHLPPSQRNEHGTVATVTIEPRFVVPNHIKLAERLRRHYALRPCLSDRKGREVHLTDRMQSRDEHLVYEKPVGTLVEHAALPVPGFEGESIRVELYRANESLDDGWEREYWRHGLLITSGRAAYDIFAGKYEREPWSQYLGWFFGSVEVAGIARLIRDYDDRLDSGLPPTSQNPIRLISRNRRGLVDRAEHPFVQAAFGALEAFLQPHLEEMRRAAEASADSRGLTEYTRRRLRDLGRVVGELIEEQDDELGGLTGVVGLPPTGLSVIPSIVVVQPGKSASFTVRYRPGNDRLPNDIAELRAAINVVEGPGRIEPSDVVLGDRGEYFSGTFRVFDVHAGYASMVSVQVGDARTECLVECRIATPPSAVANMAFEHLSYRVREGKRRYLRILVPWDLVTAFGDELSISCVGDPSIVVEPRSLVSVAYDESRLCGAAILTVRGRKIGAAVDVTASLGPSHCSAAVTVSASASAAVSIELVPEEFHQRAMWEGNVLKISTLDKSIKRYLGPQSKGWPGQHSLHFRTLLAEVVAFHSFRRVVDSPARRLPSTALDVYRRHLQLETKYVPRIHGVLLPNAELDSVTT